MVDLAGSGRLRELFNFVGKPDISRHRSGNACCGCSRISHAMAHTQLIACTVANVIGKWIAPPVTPDKDLKALGKT
jgi:hypothetical protein